jgi:hypothetical protein
MMRRMDEQPAIYDRKNMRPQELSCGDGTSSTQTPIHAYVAEHQKDLYGYTMEAIDDVFDLLRDNLPCI